MLVRALRSLFAALLTAGLTLPSTAQAPSTPPPPDQPTYTLQVNTRIVLTDVTVTDSHGNTIRNLPQSAFQVYDNNRPQTLASFHEHIQAPDTLPAAAPTASNVYSNSSVLHLPSTVNVILIDTTTIRLTDQMYLYQQLNKFVQELPSGQPVAIFNRAGQATLLLQDFTSDHELLLTAIRRAIPHFRSPDAPYTTGSDTLIQIDAYLKQVPGRKNVLWFSGGSNAFLQVDPVDEPERRFIYDMLEADRIALYPIDARGLTVRYGPARPYQQMLMEQDADATGGHAYSNNNGLAKIASHVVSTDGSYYTLTYSPDDVNRDGSWHNVKVKLIDSSYNLSYRHGYYDDGRIDQTPQGKPRNLLLANGNVLRNTDDRAKPIIFQARILPASLAPPSTASTTDVVKPKRGDTAYDIHYDIPASDIHARSQSGNNGLDIVGAGIIAFSHDGTPLSHLYQEVKLTVNEAAIRANPGATLQFDQQINIPTGKDYLSVVIWDMTTGRTGTLNLPLNVQKQPKPKP